MCLRQGFSLQVDWWCNISNENMDWKEEVIQPYKDTKQIEFLFHHQHSYVLNKHLAF